MRALVTGGAGFIGFHLARRLIALGHQVTLVDNLSRGRMDNDLRQLISNVEVTLMELNLENPSAMESLPDQFDAVFHLAAVNGTKNFYDAPYKAVRSNLTSLINVLNWAQGAQIGKLIWTSSSEAYAGSIELGNASIPTSEEVPLTISDIRNPRFSYAASKIAGESLCWNFAKQSDISVAIVRPHNVYGPRMGNDHVIPEVILRLLNEEDPFIVYGASQTRAFCFIDDFVSGLIDIAEIGAESPSIFNLGNDEETKIGDLIGLLFDVTGFHPLVTEAAAPTGSVERRCPDLTAVKKLIGYKPKMSLHEGLKRTHEWYLNNRLS